jgi:hypothetical protein
MVFAIVMGVLVIVLLVMIAYMATPAQPRLRFGESPRDHGAEAWIEDHDIDEMIEARNERRRRLGWPELGDDLERELRESLARRASGEH